MSKSLREECAIVRAKLERALALVSAVENGRPLAEVELENACRHLPYEGAVFCVPMDELLLYVVERDMADASESEGATHDL